MKKFVYTTLLALAFSNTATAALPWQDQVQGQSPEYCMGLVVGGLASNKVGGMSRSELWQAWSYLIRGGALDHVTGSNEYKSGLAQFQNAANADAAESVLQDAMGDCGLGRSGYQITGW